MFFGNVFIYIYLSYKVYSVIVMVNKRQYLLRLWATPTNLQNFPIHVIKALDIDVFLYPTLTIQASSRLKRCANHLWNNSDVCRKKLGE
jgi:hypothetical protein